MNQRHCAKLEYILGLLPGTESDPTQYVKQIILHSSQHIYQDRFYWSQKEDVLYLLSKEGKMTIQKYEEAVSKMIAYWKEHGKEVAIDTKKLLTAIGIAVSLATNREYMGYDCFEPLFLGILCLFSSLNCPFFL